MRQRNSPVFSKSMENIVGNDCCKINKPFEKNQCAEYSARDDLPTDFVQGFTLIYRELEKITPNVCSSIHILQVSLINEHFIVKVSFVA